MSEIERTVKLTAEADGGGRLDAFIADNSDITRSFAERLVTDGRVTVNGVLKQKKNTKLSRVTTYI